MSVVEVCIGDVRKSRSGCVYEVLREASNRHFWVIRYVASGDIVSLHNSRVNKDELVRCQGDAVEVIRGDELDTFLITSQGSTQRYTVPNKESGKMQDGRKTPHRRGKEG